MQRLETKSKRKKWNHEMEQFIQSQRHRRTHQLDAINQFFLEEEFYQNSFDCK